jgi:hypothetical protein
MSGFYKTFFSIVFCAAISWGYYLRHHERGMAVIAVILSITAVALCVGNLQTLLQLRHRLRKVSRVYVVCRFGEKTLVSKYSGCLPNAVVMDDESVVECAKRVNLFGFAPLRDRNVTDTADVEYGVVGEGEGVWSFKIHLKFIDGICFVCYLDSIEVSKLRAVGIPSRFVIDGEDTVPTTWVPHDTIAVLARFRELCPELQRTPMRELDPVTAELLAPIHVQEAP